MDAPTPLRPERMLRRPEDERGGTAGIGRSWARPAICRRNRPGANTTTLALPPMSMAWARFCITCSRAGRPSRRRITHGKRGQDCSHLGCKDGQANVRTAAASRPGLVGRVGPDQWPAARGCLLDSSGPGQNLERGRSETAAVGLLNSRRRVAGVFRYPLPDAAGAAGPHRPRRRPICAGSGRLQTE